MKAASPGRQLHPEVTRAAFLSLSGGLTGTTEPGAAPIGAFFLKGFWILD